MQGWKRSAASGFFGLGRRFVEGAHGAQSCDHVSVEHGSDDLEVVFEVGVCGASLGQDP